MSAGTEPKKQLGKILLQQKLVSADTLHEILEEQRRDPSSRLASTAARTGRLSMTDALRALSEQHGVPAADPTEQVVALSTLRFIPVEIARERSVLPFRVEGDKLLLAMSSPDEHELIEELEFVTGKKIQPFVGLYEVMRRVIEYAYAALERGEEYYVGAHVSVAQLVALGLPDLPRAPEPLSAYPPPAVPPSPEASAALPPMRPVAPNIDALPRVTAEVAVVPPPVPPSNTNARAVSMGMPQIAVPAALGAVAIATITIPVAEPAAAPAARAVLALEDRELRARLVELLREQRIDVHETDDGQTALELLLSETPQLLLLGTKLLGLSGLDLCRKLRASQQYSELPIIALGEALSDWRLIEDVRENFGIQHCFAPPYDGQRLARTARLLLDKREQALEPDPLSAAAEAKWNSGMEAFEHGDLDAAITQLEAGVVLEPNAFELQYHLGLLYGRREDLFGAIRALEVAVRLQGHHFAAIKNLAVVYQRVGFRHKAIDAWQRARIAAPDDETRTNIKQHMVSLL